MFRARRLLRLYPSAWRARYGGEFLEMLGPDRLQLQQVIDIIAGAIDAWLSPEVRDATRIATTTGGTTMVKSISVCLRDRQRYTTRDSVIGAAVMLIGTAILTLAGIALNRNGWPDAGDAMVNMSFLVAMMLSMPFWMMKGQPWRAQAVIIGGTLAMLAAINLVSVALN
jgi:hypothetical protein